MRVVVVVGPGGGSGREDDVVAPSAAAAAAAAAAGGAVGAGGAGGADGLGGKVGEGHLDWFALLLGRLRGGAEGGEELVVVLLLEGLAEAGEGALGGEAGLGVFLLGLEWIEGGRGAGVSSCVAGKDLRCDREERRRRLERATASHASVARARRAPRIITRGVHARKPRRDVARRRRSRADARFPGPLTAAARAGVSAPLFSLRADPRCRGREGDGTGRVSHLGGPGSGSAPCGHDGRA